MSESGSYEPAPHWQNIHDNFADARATYDDLRKRSYDDAVKKNVTANDCVPKSLTTDSESPLVICCDVTGSMGTWSGVIFGKLPYLEYEAQEYLGDNMQISFAAVCDGPRGDKYPLQVRPFVKGKELKDQLEKLIDEGASNSSCGGGNQIEGYDLAAAYYGYNCHMPEAIRKPIFIFIGDEGIYSTVYSDFAKNWAHINDAKLTPEGVFERLKEKFNVYCIRKPYGYSSGDYTSSEDRKINAQWCNFIGEDHVGTLPAAERVVDAIFGILAKETGRIEYFKKELEERQGKDKDGKQKIEIVMKSLATIHKISENHTLPKIEGPKGAASKSVKASKSVGDKSISLLEE